MHGVEPPNHDYVSSRGFFFLVIGSNTNPLQFAVYGDLYSCAFEDTDDLCGWTDDTTVESTFQSNKGATGSADTGPSTDHTFGDENG